VKLLRVLQERKIRRLGSNQELPIDVRVIAASNRNLKEEVVAGRFREDLYFRLKGAEMSLPPLAGRKSDIIPLMEHFAQRAVNRVKREAVFSRGVRAGLLRYEWPGNVRELEGVIDHAVESCKGIVLLSDLPLDLQAVLGHLRAEDLKIETLRKITDAHIDRALAATGGNQAQACKLLGVERKFISRRRRGNDSVE
jgi:two-component system response regulator HydG